MKHENKRGKFFLWVFAKNDEKCGVWSKNKRNKKIEKQDFPTGFPNDTSISNENCQETDLSQ